MCGTAGGQGKGLFRVKSTWVSHPWRWYPDCPHWWCTLFRSHSRRRICWYLPLSSLCLQPKLSCPSLKYIVSCCLDSKPFCMFNLYAWAQFQVSLTHMKYFGHRKSRNTQVCFLLVYHDADHISKHWSDHWNISDWISIPAGIVVDLFQKGEVLPQLQKVCAIGMVVWSSIMKKMQLEVLTNCIAAWDYFRQQLVLFLQWCTDAFLWSWITWGELWQSESETSRLSASS